MARVLTIVRVVQLRVAMVALVIMMLVTVADVFMRYTVHKPIEGVYNIVECCLAVFVFFGASSTFIDRRNIVIDLVDAVAPRPVLATVIHVADGLSILCLSVIGWSMIDPMLQVAAYGDAKPQLGLPLVYLWIAALVGLAGTIISAVGALGEPTVGTKER